MHRRPIIILFVALALLLPMLAAASAQEIHFVPRHLCEGSIGVPLDLALASSAISPAPGQTDDIVGTVTARANLASVRVSLTTEGGLEILGPTTIELGPAGTDGKLTFHVSVRYGTSGRGALQAHVLAERADNHATLERNEGLYAITRLGRITTDMGDYLLADRKAIFEAKAKGQIDPLAAQVALEKVSVLTGTSDSSPRSVLPVAPEIAREAASVASSLAPARLPGDAIVSSKLKFTTGPNGKQIAEQTAGTVTVHGQILWTDENGTMHPAFGLTVQVRDDELIGSDLVAEGAVDEAGNYSFAVDNDDGPFQGGRDIFVRVLTGNGAVTIEPLGGGGPYAAESSINNDVPDGTDITWNFTAANTGTGPSAGLAVGATWVAIYAHDLNGGSFLPHLRLEWPGTTSSANFNGSRINLRPGDRWDWDVMFHEYGHYVQQVFDIANNPGGPHNIGDCISDVHSSKDEGVRMAWGEGWPTFFGTTGQQKLNLALLGVPRVGDVLYTDTGESNFFYSLETNSAPPSSGDANGLGEDNEIAVQRVLWDLQDSASDSRDNISVSDQVLFDKINAADPTTLSAGWAALRAGLSNADDLAYGAITTDHQIGPALLSPANNAIVSPSSSTFSWQKYVGCSTTYDGDNFDLVFYNAATKAKILTLSGLTTTSTTLTLGQIGALITSTHNVLWAVEGRNTSSPATGPYLGENRAATINRPPVANAGLDQTVECASHATTAVTLDGSGSSDPDGDALTYTWSAFGVTFNDIHAQKPVGQFTEGTTTVTLSVSDGVESRTDQVSIKVQDTTPPVIHCPSSITVECDSPGGNPATDPAIAAFLAGASATDVCDATPTLSNNGPSFFPDGVTHVKFTATDDDGNASDCTADVKVVDTTPPTLAVSLNREFLWPPNHKLSDILVDVVVTDICDPHPTFVLTSITSNEPINGLGDGDTSPDWVGADLGTADVMFQLRSERAGVGSGRKYTITYTASDEDGNTTVVSVFVRVAHDQSGNAVASLGLDNDGTNFAPGAEEFTVVVPTLVAGAEDEGLTQNSVTAAPGGIGPGSLLMNATGIDGSRAWLGNSRGVIEPREMMTGDINGDGLDDVAFQYGVAETRALRDASTPDDGPIGLHYQIGPVRTWLVDNIFALGAPVALPANLRISSTDATRRATTSAAKGGTVEAKAAPAATQTPAAQAPVAAQAPISATQAVAVLPSRTQLAGVFPNPFAKSANVAFDLASEASVHLEVYDVRGARVCVLRDGLFSPGRYRAIWDGRDASGRDAARGLYFIRFQAGTVHAVSKVVLSE